MAIGVVELVLVVLVVGGILMFVFSSGRKSGSHTKGGGFSLGHATLNCPHCRKETRADHPQCEHCGEEL